MFDNPRYVTRGINATLPPVLVVFLWQLIDDRRDSGAEMDYLQMFQLCPDTGSRDNIQLVQHSQEMPDYRADYQIAITGATAIYAKVYVIDDYTHSTMLLSDEY